MKQTLVRIQRSTANRDGFIARRVNDGKVGFIVPAHSIAHLGVTSGQVWNAAIEADGPKYCKVRLLEQAQLAPAGESPLSVAHVAHTDSISQPFSQPSKSSNPGNQSISQTTAKQSNKQ